MPGKKICGWSKGYASMKRWYVGGDTASYSYGFNGMRKDNEMYGDGNAYDFGARIYDNRLGRWLSVDPLQAKYHDLSPYNFVGNSPIIFVDLDGRKFINPFKKKLDRLYTDLQTATALYNAALDAFNNCTGKDGVDYELSKQKILKAQAALNSVAAELQETRVLYGEVQDYLTTLSLTRPDVYYDLDNLKDVKGNTIDIVVTLNDNFENRISVSGKTKNMMAFDYSGNKFDDDDKAYMSSNVVDPDTRNLTIIIELIKNSDKTYDGRNYRTFANEIGDIVYAYTMVNNWDDAEFWSKSMQATNPEYFDPKGAGQSSFRFENESVELVNEFVSKRPKEFSVKSNGVIGPVKK